MWAKGVAGAVAAALAVAVLPACGLQVTGPSLVLRLASPDKATDDTTAVPIQRFVDEVDRLSGGTVRIEPVWNVDAGESGWDQVVARSVADGTYELGLVPGRAWDVLGVDTLRALNAPFLLTSPAALEAVLESDLRDELLSGLPEAGVVGIDLFPDGMRHPFGYGEPLLAAADYDGESIRAAKSLTTGRVFESLGATVTDSDPDEFQYGAESQFSVAPSGAKVATGNVTFFPKTNALVMTASVRERLRPDQWELLREAAAETRDWSIAEQPSDFEAAAAYCDQGGEIVAATPGQVADLRDSTATVTTWLRSDPSTRRIIDRIRDLTDGLPAPEPVTECPGESATPDATSRRASALDGTYFAHVTRQDLREAGVIDNNLLDENTGRYTWTLDSGTWTYHTEAGHYIANPDDTGRFTYDDGLFTLYWTDIPGNWTRLRVHATPNGALRFTDIQDGNPGEQALSEGFFRRPWARIGTP